MSKNKNKRTVISTVNKAINTTKDLASKTNNFALDTTENVVLETIKVAGQWQKVSDKALKSGLKLMANQQDMVFDALEVFKSQLVQSKNRATKIFS